MPPQSSLIRSPPLVIPYLSQIYRKAVEPPEDGLAVSSLNFSNVLASDSWLDCVWSLTGLVDAVGLVDFGKYGALILDSIVRASLCKILDRIGFGIGDLISERDNGRLLVG